MKRTWVDSLSRTRGFLARRFIFAAGACLATVLGAASPIQAETFPISGTAGFETGRWRIASAYFGLRPSKTADINWGDGTPRQRGLLNCFITEFCDVYGTHRYALAGTYTITVEYPALFGTDTETTTATIGPPSGDFVILSIGDSVASGEGNPEIAAQTEAFWDDPGSNYASVYVGDLNTQEERNEFGRKDCHRTRLAGHARAALAVQQNNPAITVVHFACSGATVKTIFRNTSNAVSQLRVARSHLPRIDVLLISAGANSLNAGDFGSGFGGLLLHCVLNPPATPCSQDDQFRADINKSMAELQGEYAKLDQEIHCINPDDGMPEPNCTDPEKQIPKLVLITEYFDPTHDADGNFPSGLANLACTGTAISAPEWAFLYNNVVVPLNEQVFRSP